MPTQLQLEGPDLESLLARVRAEHGAGARIVQAEKVRSGGMGGFFAKQHFEIVVELDDAAAAPAAPAPAPRITSLLELADEVSDVERASAPSIGPVSTESTGFAAVLARLGATAGEEAAAAPQVTIPRQRRAPAPARTAAARPAQPSTPQRKPAARKPAARRTTPPVAPTVLTGTVVRAGTSVARAAAPGTAVAVRTVPAPGATAVRSAGTVAVRTRSAIAVAVAEKPVPVPVPSPAARKAVARTRGALQAAGRATQHEIRTQDVTAQLAGLGLPDHLQPERTDAGLHPALVDSLRALPKAPRLTARAGAVLAVVGPLAHAQEVAEQLAQELGLPRTAVVRAGTAGSTAGPRAVTELRRRRDTWRKRRHATLVVVDSPLTAAGALRARALVSALQPTTTYGVVEATRKTRDVGAWASAVGAIDALALTSLDETADPASALELGIPVGRLGDRKATAAEWATLLTDRVA